MLHRQEAYLSLPDRLRKGLFRNLFQSSCLRVGNVTGALPQGSSAGSRTGVAPWETAAAKSLVHRIEGIDIQRNFKMGIEPFTYSYFLPVIFSKIVSAVKHKQRIVL